MITNLLDSPIGFGIAVGFVAGSFGYILARFWFRPLLAYAAIKRKIAAALADAGKNQGLPDAAALRRHAAALSDCYSDTLPNWYKLALVNREESPVEAARHLMSLAGTRDPGHVADRMKQVRKHLRLR